MTLLDGIIWAHVVTGFVGLAAFWVPVFVRKGGSWHVRVGRVYEYCAYVVTLSAVAAAVGRIGSYASQGIGLTERPEIYGFAFFLGYLGIATFASVRHAVRVVQTKRDPEAIRTGFHRALAWASLAGSASVIIFALVAWSDASIVLLALSPVGISVGTGIRQYLAEPAREHMGWWYSHMSVMIGGGIAFHTAFAVFGAQRLWDYELAGALGVLPWILPALIGIPGGIVWERYYRRKFKPATAAVAA